mgnify:CR=1 FL=1
MSKRKIVERGLVSPDLITTKIYSFRGKKVMLDEDLARACRQIE